MKDDRIDQLNIINWACETMPVYNKFEFGDRIYVMACVYHSYPRHYWHASIL